MEIVQDREGLCTPREDQKSQELALQEVHDLQCEAADLVVEVVGVVGAAEVGLEEGCAAAEVTKTCSDPLELESEN